MTGGLSSEVASVNNRLRVKAGVKRTAIALALLALAIYGGFYLLMANA